MKNLIAAAALLCGAASAAQAITYQVEFSNLSEYNDALSILGADPSATSMTFTWEVDETAGLLTTPYSYSYSGYSYQWGYLPYETFSMSVGGVTLLGGPSTSTNDRVYLLDGISDGSGNIYDLYQVFTNTNQVLSDGWYVDYFYLTMYDYDETSFSGLDHPSAEELNNLDQYRYSYVILRNAVTGGYARLSSNSAPTVTEVPTVPLPAGAPLLIGGLAAFAFLRRRQRA